MRKPLSLFLFLFLCLIASPLSALLSDSDPKNFFALLENSSVVVLAKVKSSQVPKAEQRFYLYQLKASRVLKGSQDMQTLGVMDESLTPGEPARLPSDGEFLIFLGRIPAFTAYQALSRQGYDYRLLGGPSGVLPNSDETATLASQYLQTESGKRYAILLQALQGSNPRLSGDAALALAGAGKIDFTGAEIEAISTAILERPLPDAAKVALVKALENSGGAPGVQALQKISDAPTSPAKWASIRALDRLGFPRPLARLADDFRRANDSEKNSVLGLILSKKDAAAEEFVAGVLAGPFAVEVKKTAMDSMAENKTPGYENLLLKQVPQGEEALRAEAVLALGKMGSSQAVPLVIPLLDSPLPALRAAAFFMLTESSDPRAEELISKRYTRDHHGVWEQNQHFYGNTGPARPQ